MNSSYHQCEMSTNPIYSPRFELQAGGTTYQEVGGRVGDLLVETTVDGADLCSFTLNYPYDPEHQEFDELDWSAVEPGTSLEVSLGWGGGGSVEPVFVGTSQSVKVDFDPGGAATVTVSGYGPLHEMMQGVNERSWSETTVTDVAKEVLNSHFSGVEVDGGGSKQNRIIQHGTNDYRFVRGLAEEYGFEFYAERDTAHFTRRSSIGGESPGLTLTYGNTLDTFSGESTVADQVATVEVKYWDMQAEKEVVGSASGEGEGKEVFRVQCDSKEEADAIAESKLSALSMSRVRGYGETDGIPELTAGMVVELDGLGERFSGNYYVTSATHSMGGAGYRTSFEVTELPE